MKKHILIIFLFIIAIIASWQVKYYTPKTELHPWEPPVTITKNIQEDIFYNNIIADIEALTGADNYSTPPIYGGYYIVNNYRAQALALWYNPYERDGSLSIRSIGNGSVIYPSGNAYTNNNGNTFVPFEYEGDVYWLLYENFNGQNFLEYYPADN